MIVRKKNIEINFSIQVDQFENKKQQEIKKPEIESKPISEPTEQQQHTGICCDNCHKQNFFGKRYQCLTCSDYDLCEVCFPSRNNFHTKNHPFKIVNLIYFLKLNLSFFRLQNHKKLLFNQKLIQLFQLKQMNNHILELLVINVINKILQEKDFNVHNVLIMIYVKYVSQIEIHSIQKIILSKW